MRRHLRRNGCGLGMPGRAQRRQSKIVAMHMAE